MTSVFQESRHLRSGSGQFAPMSTPESRIDLVEADDEAGMDADTLLASARRSAMYLATKYDLDDPDDLAQEACAVYLNQVANHDRHGTLHHSTGYTARNQVKSIAQGVAQKWATGIKHGGPTLSAYIAHRKAMAEHESAIGEPMSVPEQDALADRIRSSWTGSRPPDKNFHRARPVRSSDDVAADMVPDRVFGEAPSAEDEYLEEVSDGRSDDRAEDAVAQTRVKAKKELWSVLAYSRSAPDLEPRSVSHDAAAAMMADRERHGSVADLVGRFDGPGLSRAESRALFAPWGDRAADRDAQERIVNVLLAHRSLSDDIWSAAVLTVSRRPAPGSQRRTVSSP